jgi:flagellar hook-associated protein 1 FlgK
MLNAERQVDQLAFDLGNALNTVHQGGFALDGSGGRDLFNVSGTVEGAARGLRINSVISGDPSLFAASGSATSGPGDSVNLQLLIGTETQALSGGLTVTSTIATLTTAYGAATERATAINEGDQALLSHLSAIRASASGVSIDEELVNMQKSQRAYDAIAKVIKTADEMLGTLMALR